MNEHDAPVSINALACRLLSRLTVTKCWYLLRSEQPPNGLTLVQMYMVLYISLHSGRNANDTNTGH